MPQGLNFNLKKMFRDGIAKNGLSTFFCNEVAFLKQESLKLLDQSHTTHSELTKRKKEKAGVFLNKSIKFCFLLKLLLFTVSLRRSW